MGQLLEARVLLVVLVSFVHVEALSKAALLFPLVFTLLSRMSWLILSTELSMSGLLAEGYCDWRVTQLTWWLCFVRAPVGPLGGDTLFERGVYRSPRGGE